jgi:hypothetical protein
VLAAEGAALFLERVSPALEHVDGSSGAIGSAVNRAIEQLVPLIASAPIDIGRRSVWLERLWEAYAADAIPYIETLGDFWGDLCANRQLASAWADALIEDLRRSWDQELPGHYFHSTMVCLSSLLGGRTLSGTTWLARQGTICLLAVSALGCQGAGRNGKEARGARLCGSLARRNDNPAQIAIACEEVLLSMGRAGEAYQRYAIAANQAASNLATYRAILRKYPHKAPEEVLRDPHPQRAGRRGQVVRDGKGSATAGTRARACQPLAH